MAVAPNNRNKMETELKVRTDSSMYNANTLGRQLIHEEHNSAYNHHVIVEAVKAGRARDINDEPKVDKTPCFILGSGPSLDDIMPKLKDWQGGIICTTSHALSLMYYGIEPTHIMALDPFNCWAEIAGVDWSKTRTKLVTTPGVWPTLIANWPNDMLLYRQSLGGKESYYGHGQNRMYTTRRPKHDEDKNNPDGICRDAVFEFIIRTEVIQFACSPPCQMFVADILGYGRIFTAGMDFGCSGDKERFSDFTIEKPGQTVKVGNAPDIEVPPVWKKNEHLIGSIKGIYSPGVETKKENQVEKSGEEDWALSANGLKTSEMMLFYKKNFLTAWRLSLQDVYTCDKGIITEMPYADIDKVIKTQGRGFKRTTHDFIIDRSERYLAKVGAFVISSSAGFSFVESNHPVDEWQNDKGEPMMPDLLRFMREIDGRYSCDTQGHQIQTDAAENVTGKKCPQCDGKLVKAVTIDVEANMKRFKRLVMLAGGGE